MILRTATNLVEIHYILMFLHLNKKKKNPLWVLLFLEFTLYQKVQLLKIRKTTKNHTSKGIKNTFGTLQKPKVPFGVLLL